MHGYVLKYQKSGMLNDIAVDGTQDGATPEGFAKILRSIYEMNECDVEVKEHCFCLLLNRNLKPLGYIKVSEGGLTATIIDVRLIVKAALDLNADAVILCHNHPSGNPHPGSADIKETERLKKACDVFSIRLTDHLILTADAVYSFADEQTYKI